MPNRRGSKRDRPTIQQRVGLFLRLYAELKKEPYGQGLEVSISFGFPQSSIETNTQRQEFRAYLMLFRQLISPDDNVFLGAILGELPRHVDDAALRDRLSRASDAWKAANGVQSEIAALVLGPYAAGSEMARLYLNGGVSHSDLHLTAVWDALGPDQQRLFEWEVRQYEGRVRKVFIELKEIIDAAQAANVLRDEPLELGRK